MTSIAGIGSATSLRWAAFTGLSSRAQPAFTPNVDLDAQLGELRTLVEDFRLAMRKFDAAVGRAARPASVTSPAAVTSSQALGLDLTSSVSRLRSTEEVNTTPTSFSTREPTWSGTSTSTTTVGGTYDGSRGDTTLTFTVTKSAGQHQVGTHPIDIEVRDSTNTLLDTIQLRDTYTLGTEITLSTGLTVAFSSGTIELNETFTVDVSSSIGTDLDAADPFNGTGDAHPELEDTFTVSDGSFDLQGTTINVFASDSLNTLLSRINSSGAGVTASYDSANDQVVFEHETAGANTISLTNDTSGVLDALKLTGATTELGTSPDDEEPMADVAAFSSVAAGTITVNNTAIAIDPSTDSLNDVLARIDAVSGVSASYSGDQVTIRSTSSTGIELVDTDSTGFFDAVNVATGQHSGEVSATGRLGATRSTVDEASKALVDLSSALQRIFNSVSEGSTSLQVWFRKEIVKAVNAAHETGSESLISSDLGLTFDFRGLEGDKVLDVGPLSLRKFDAALRRDWGTSVDILYGDDNQRDGLIERLRDLGDKALERIDERIETVGGLFDLRV